MPERRPAIGLIWLGALAIVGSLVALVYAFLVDVFACDEATSAACTRQDLASLQLRIAIAGALVVTFSFLSAAFGRRTLAMLLLGCSVLLYAGWGIVIDAAVHGWGSIP